VEWGVCAGAIGAATGVLARVQWAYYKKHL
jgi:hypothetical protein